jgi:hypothetical protein
MSPMSAKPGVGGWYENGIPPELMSVEGSVRKFVRRIGMALSLCE